MAQVKKMEAYGEQRRMKEIMRHLVLAMSLLRVYSRQTRRGK
jgi:hypothetical protein